MRPANHHDAKPAQPLRQSHPPATSPATEPIRLLFEMDREDNPLLYDDLIRFKKGTKRVNRLRFLAHEGVVAQASLHVQGRSPIGGSMHGLSELGRVPHGLERRPTELVVSPGEAAQMSQVFSHSLDMEDD
jgi:hypothetical protein